MSQLERPQTLIGAVLNRRYQLVSVLGEGGIAVVYRAEPVDGSPAVAIKVLRPEFRGDAEVVERFLAEAVLAERIQHPGVVKVHGAHRAEDGTAYLVTELLHGYPLSVPMNRGRTPVEQAVRIVGSLLDVLTAAHQVGIVHRDLKPDNVFLESSETSAVRLLDFGISRAVQAAGGSARRTRTGMLLGTPGYMSPEQVLNSKQADHRSDLFSTAVLFYELISGQRAFQRDTEYERMMAVLFEDARPIEQAAPQFAHWREFFAKALHRDMEARFQSAQQMRDALDSVATQGRMPEPKFGGDSTAVSPAALPLAAGAVRACDVQVVSPQPRAVRLNWVFAVALVSLMLGFVGGFMVAGQ